MDETNDYHYDFKVESSTMFTCESPTSLNPNSTPFLGVHINSYVNRYDWRNNNHSIPNVAYLEDYEPGRVDNRSIQFGFFHFSNSSSWTDMYSNSMATVNSHITRGSKVHFDILSEISRIIDDVDDADRCTILTH